MVAKLSKKIAGEWLLVLSILGVMITSLYLHRFPGYDETDFKVVYILLVFLIIIKGLERTHFLHNVAARFERGKWLAQRLIILTAILSMFVTNDVALLTVVPITLALDVKDKELLIILETLTANAASALTPFGNPQNIFIYFHYHLHPVAFVKTIAPFCGVSLACILFLSFKKADLSVENCRNSSMKLNWVGYSYLALFGCFILAILKIVPLATGGIVIIFALIFDRESFNIDWFLLATFLAFFGFTDNLEKIIHISINNPLEAFLYPALGSQIMSNVPGALFFADFTSNWKALLWGVSVGGFGSLVGSLASLISYRLYRAKTENQNRYLVKFHIYNYVLFAIGVATYILCFAR